MIRPVKISGTTDGSGDADVTGDGISGLLMGVQGNLSSLDATADVTITFASTDGTDAISVLTITNSNTDFYTRPSPGAVDTSNSAVTNAYPPFAVSGKPRVVVAQGGATKAFDVVLYVDDLKP